MDRYSLIALFSAAALTMIGAASAQAPEPEPEGRHRRDSGGEREPSEDLPFADSRTSRTPVAASSRRSPTPRSAPPTGA